AECAIEPWTHYRQHVVMANGYDTVDDAASAALGLVSKNRKSRKQEFIGLIYQDPETGKYLFTEPQTQRDANKSKGAFKVPKGSARALFHNHPSGGANKGDLFSSDDIAMANSSGLLSYIAAGDALKVYDPSQNAKPMRRGVAGSDVLAQIAMDL